MSKSKLIKKTKRLICLILITAAALCAAAFPCRAHETSADTNEVLKLLNELEIMRGDPDGNLRLGDTVTRAEFTKMAVASSDLRHSAASSLSVSPFYDTPYTHWAAPYVRVGVSGGFVSGYPDASFRPDNSVAYEEAVTIMLRVLGYTDEDFGAAWPAGQLGMAESLDMTDNIENTAVGSAMSRGDCAALIYNTLRCRKKNAQTELVSIFDVSFVEGATLISTSREDSAIPGDEVFTDAGSFKINSDFNYDQIGMRGDIALKNNKTVLGFFPDKEAAPDEKYVVYSMLGNDVVAYSGGNLEILDIPDSAAAYDGTQRSTFGAVKAGLEMGDVINIRRTGGDIDYALINKGGMLGPYTVTADSSYISGIGMSNSTKISRGGKNASISDIRANDILYYVPELDMAFVYTNKITGVYENASPNKDNPTEITVSGTTYKVESAEAFIKLSSTGSAAFGDTVTLLLGKNNDVADILTASAGAPAEITGYAVAAGTKTYSSGDLKNRSGNYITVITPGGESREYITDRDCADYVNSVVSVSIDSGEAKVSRVSKAPGAGGVFRYERMTLGSNKVASDAKILDVGTTDRTMPSLYAVIYPARLDNVNINADKVLYFHKNSAGEIDELILNDVTGDSYTFGIAKSVQNVSMGLALNGSYTYIVNGTEYSYATSNTIFSISGGSGIRLTSAANPYSISALTELRGSAGVTSQTNLSCGGKNYAISPNVQVYEKESRFEAEYSLIPISDIVGSDGYDLIAYYDKLPENGGRIRIIVATKK